MSQMQQGRGNQPPTARGLSRLGAASRRAVGYFVAPAEPEAREPRAGRAEEATTEFAHEEPGWGITRSISSPTLPAARSGGYEREAVDARLAELERELVAARAAAATPTGVEAEIQRLGEETAEILRVAHKQAEELVARAVEQAAALRAAAQADADAVTQAAERRLRQIDSETDQIWAERTRLTDDTLRVAEALREIADGAIERFPAAVDEPAPPHADEPAPPHADEPAPPHAGELKPPHADELEPPHADAPEARVSGGLEPRSDAPRPRPAGHDHHEPRAPAAGPA